MSNRPSPERTRRSIRSSAPSQIKKSRFRPTLEGLEPRVVLSTITWSGNGDGTTFSSGANWTGGVAPGSGDDAEIAISGFGDIKFPTGGITLHSLTVGAKDTLNLSAGTLTTTTGLSVDGGATLNVSGGSVVGSASIGSSTLNFSGGAISATITNSTLNESSSITSTDSFVMLGADTVSGPISSGQTLTVQATSSAAATLNAAAGATNAGTILLQTDSDTSNRSNLNVASGSTFVNTGTVEGGYSGFINQITGGNFDNRGTLTVDSGGILQFEAPGSTFTQEGAGTLSAVGDFYITEGTLLVDGGAVSGNVLANGCSLQLANSITVPTTIDAVGTGITTLVANASPLGTVWVEGNDTNTDDTLTVAAGAVNVGTILLQSAAGADYNSTLNVASGTTFVNTGTIQVGASLIPSEITGGNFDNQGTVAVASSAHLIFDAPGSTFTQDTAGTISAVGEFNFSQGTLLVAGGTVSGNVESGASLRLASTISVPTTIDVDGGTLLGNAAALGTVCMQADPENVDETLTIAAGAVNVGTILFQNPDAAGDCDLTVASGSTFVNAGTFVMAPGAFGYLTGSFSNAGTLDIEGATLNLTYGSSALVNQPGGVMNAWGGLNAGAGFTNEGTLNIETGQSASLGINGSYTQTATGSLDVEIGGTVAGVTYDQLAVSGSVSLAGTLAVSILNGYSASLGNSFSVLSYASATGSFAAFTGIDLANGLILQPTQTSTAVTLTAATSTIFVTATAGSTQTTTVASAFPTALQATVDDKFGDPLSGVVVTFVAPKTGAGGSFAGNLTTVTATTNAQGIATAPAFTAGTAAGSYSVTATAAGLSNQASFSLTNTAGAAAGVTATAGTSQGATVGKAFAAALQATVDDQYGNLVAGAVVTFAAPASGAGGSFVGNLSIVTATTNAQGVATAPAFTANTIAGGFAVVATVTGVSSSASFSLTNAAGAASSIIASAGTSQSAVVGKAFGTALQVTVDDQYGNPVGNVSVSFAAPSSGIGGSFVAGKTVSVTTNAQGVASAPAFTANTTAGGYAVVATVIGVSSSASFSLINLPGAASSVVATAGTPQSTGVGTSFAKAFQATVDDQYGNPIAGVIVTFTAPTGGSFSGSKTATATTNAQGLATAPAFTASTTAGGYGVSATVPGTVSTATFNLTNAPGTAASLAIVSGSSQVVVVGAGFSTALEVVVEDQYKNPIPGVVVTFTAPATGAGGSFSGTRTATATTNALGVATAPAFTANASVGSYTIAATVSGLSASFSLSNTAKTSTTLASSSALAPIDQLVTFTATVAALAPATGKPGGSVSFYDGAKLLGSVTLNSQGQATYSTSALTYGSHSITASYAGGSGDLTSGSTSVPIRVGDTVVGDYSGVGKANVAYFDQTTATFYVTQANGTTRTQQLGNPAHKNIPVVADFDGDGKDDFAVYDQTAAEFLILDSGGGSLAQPFGNPSHVNIPVAGDFDGDGKTNVAIFDQTTATFAVLEPNGTVRIQQLGNPTHVNIPVAGDFDGDGKTDFAVYDQTAAEFLILDSGGGSLAKPFGNPSHINIPVASDFDGDGKTNVAIFDQTTATFAILQPNGTVQVQQFGNPADANTPIPDDFDGAGKADIAIYDANAGEFLIILSDGMGEVLPMGNVKHKILPV